MNADDPIRILVVPGSLREASYSGRLARLASDLADDLGATTTIFDDLRAVEPFDEDLELLGADAAPGAAAFKRAIRDHDAVFVVTPEYNASIPGQLKNAFDWASRADSQPFRSLPDSPMFAVPVAVASASTGQFGAVWARDELLKALRTQGARVVTEPQMALPNAASAWDEAGTLRAPGVRERMRELLGNLIEQAGLVRAAREAAAATSHASG